MLPVGFDQIKALIPKKSGFMKGLKALVVGYFEKRFLFAPAGMVNFQHD